MDPRHPLGTVAQLWLYPVKALAPIPLDAARVVTTGFEGDRQTALFVGSDGHPRRGKTYRGKENNLLHTVATLERAIDLAAGRKVAVEPAGDGPYFDAQAVSIVFDTWVDELQTLLGMPLDPQRFRPNIYALAAPGFSSSETDLVGTIVQAGGVTLEVVAPIKRCVTVTYDVASGVADPRVARAIALERDNILGIYCTVRAPGTIARGETLWSDRSR